MNQKKSSKSTVLKYLLIVPLTFSLVVISNAETLVSKAKDLLESENSAKLEMVDNFQKVESANELVVVGYANQAEPQKKTAIVPPPPPPPVPGKPDKDNVFMVVEEMPKYPGGNQAMFKYLGENIKYPASAQESSIQGRVICSFIVNVDGSIADTKIVRGIEPDLDAEAIRVINAMPTWVPGKQSGKLVRVKYTLPITFKLQGDSPNKGKEVAQPTENSPLIVLDGKVLPADFKMNSINPQSIEKVDVLKGTSATEMYGDKGKNGVIVITSKK